MLWWGKLPDSSEISKPPPFCILCDQLVSKQLTAALDWQAWFAGLYTSKLQHSTLFNGMMCIQMQYLVDSNQWYTDSTWLPKQINKQKKVLQLQHCANKKGIKSSEVSVKHWFSYTMHHDKIYSSLNRHMFKVYQNENTDLIWTESIFILKVGFIPISKFADNPDHPPVTL